VPIDPRLQGYLLEAVKQTLDTEWLFTFNGRKILDVKKSFRTACKLAKLGGFHFHDLRHTCMTAWARANHGHSLIMAASGHKTFSCFKRYVNFKTDDLLKLVSGQNGHLVDTQEKALVCNAS
ncbi:MAG: tyrosine-type recombinase/integrase, partial [Fibrobacterota bacterium]